MLEILNNPAASELTEVVFHEDGSWSSIDGSISVSSTGHQIPSDQSAKTYHSSSHFDVTSSGRPIQPVDLSSPSVAIGSYKSSVDKALSMGHLSGAADSFNVNGSYQIHDSASATEVSCDMYRTGTNTVRCCSFLKM
ncbi:unnamed protein product [Protopolystoma xenopodis]|uniref:Uncharacterized protein n=1 Tax=Protopolystoma xenopodis TaxID=117903 RepID=A0A3S4ZD67_9PLAT|nr:unnamed protein product [Protopolystoma xenopodis]